MSKTTAAKASTKKKKKDPKKEPKSKEKKTYSYKTDDYQFTNFYESETQLKDITHVSPPESILKAFDRLIQVHASNHEREGVELEDLCAEGRKGVVEAIKEFNDPKRKKPNYNFHQACLYKIRSSIFQYCLRNAVQLKTPYYIQRGCMHVAQIFKLMTNQTVAEALLKRKGPAMEEEIVVFLKDEKERLPLKPISFIKKQITKDKSEKEFNQILSGIMNHELGSRHSYVKNNLTDIGKVLHIKEKLWFTAFSNNMPYERVIQLILEARQSKVELNPNIFSHTPASVVDKGLIRKEMIKMGKNLCGSKEFEIFVKNKVMDMTYEEIAAQYKIKKGLVIEIIKNCIKELKRSEEFRALFTN